MRISDWSSDVCSSDLPPAAAARAADPGGDRVPARTGRAAGVAAAPLSASPQARGGPDVGYAGVLAQSAASSAGTPFPIRGTCQRIALAAGLTPGEHSKFKMTGCWPYCSGDREPFIFHASALVLGCRCPPYPFSWPHDGR